MKKFLTLIIGIAFFAMTGNAQEIPKGALYEEKSDPEATLILEKVNKKYENYKTISIDFSLAIEIPEEETERHKGKMLQSGDMFFIDLPMMAMYCDGKVIWTHLKDQQEVQLNNFEPGEETEEILSPKDILKIYKSDKYYYVLMNEVTEKGVMIQEIEFKPKERDTEYLKIRATINKNTSELMRLKVFSRDGSRYTFEIENTEMNKTISNSAFVFDKTKAPEGTVFEDLRTD